MWISGFSIIIWFIDSIIESNKFVFDQDYFTYKH